MIEFLKDISSWIAWLGIGGIVGFLALLFFAPSIAKVVGAALEPVARAVGEGVVWLFRDVLWVGMKDMLDNWASIVFVIAAVMVGGYFLSTKPTDCKAAVEQEVAKLRAEYKFVPRTPAEKKAALPAPKKDQPVPCWYCLR